MLSHLFSEVSLWVWGGVSQLNLAAHEVGSIAVIYSPVAWQSKQAFQQRWACLRYGQLALTVCLASTLSAFSMGEELGCKFSPDSDLGCGRSKEQCPLFEGFSTISLRVIVLPCVCACVGCRKGSVSTWRLP